MASTEFVNDVTLTDADWFNDVDRVVYDILQDPADAAAARAALGITDTGGIPGPPGPEGPAGVSGPGVITVQDDTPTLSQGEQWFESDTGGLYMRYVNPDATETLIAAAPAGGDFIGTASKGVPNGVPSLDASGTIPVAQLPPTNAVNRIINGKFAIDQRFAGGAAVAIGASGGATGIYTMDRWLMFGGGSGQWGAGREMRSSGLYNFVASVAIADATITAGDGYGVQQRIEGSNIADFGLGAAGASSFTYAFTVYCSITGTFSVSFRSGDGARSYVAPFTIPTINTWQTVVITVPGDIAGTWTGTTGAGLIVTHPFGWEPGGSTATTNTWLAGSFLAMTGQTNFMATAGNVMRIRNVRLYKGTQDYGPDQRLYAEELALCQRYYQKSYDIGVVPGTVTPAGELTVTQVVGASTGLFTHDVRFPVPMRAAPTVTLFNPQVAANAQMRNVPIAVNFTSTAAAVISESNFTVQAVTPAGTAAGQLCVVHWTASAEL